ncbi:MAG: SPOR domain-containing protein [Rhodospirillaceae bacterium]
MKKSFALGIGVVVLGGCALPGPLQVASWALDGISYIATDKSMTDHGLSLVAQKDCALLRGVTQGTVCREWDDAATLVADAGEPKHPTPTIAAPSERIGHAAAAHSGIPPLNTDLDTAMPNVETLASFSTAAGPAKPVPAVAPKALRPLSVAAKPAPAKSAVALRVAATVKPKPAQRKRLPTPVTATVQLPLPAAAAVRFAATTHADPTAGIYYVIGSFRNYANAFEFASRYERLVPDVLAANLDGAPVFRVVVGPVAQGAERNTYRQIADAGLKDSWAIRVVPGDWRLARKVITRKQRIGGSQELAHAAR